MMISVAKKVNKSSLKNDFDRSNVQNYHNKKKPDFTAELFLIFHSSIYNHTHK